MKVISEGGPMDVIYAGGRPDGCHACRLPTSSRSFLRVAECMSVISDGVSLDAGQF